MKKTSVNPLTNLLNRTRSTALAATVSIPSNKKYVRINAAMPFTRGKFLETGVMICETLVQTLVLMAHPKTSAPASPASETRKRKSPIISASQSSLSLGAGALPKRLGDPLKLVGLIKRFGNRRTNTKTRGQIKAIFSQPDAAHKKIARCRVLLLWSDTR